MKNKIYKILYSTSLLAVLGSAAYIIFYYFELYQSNAQNENIQEVVKIQLPIDNLPNIADQIPEIDFVALKEINTDAVAWILIENTSIDYPVLQSTNNEYYLTHNVYKVYDRHGAVFMDHRNKISDENIIVYAHNMKNGTMFADVAKYKNIEYKEKFPILKLIMENVKFEYEVLAAFYYNTRVDDFQYLIRNFQKDERKDYVKFLNKKSIYGKIYLEDSDHLMTLSTCNYDSNGDRFVVILKKIQNFENTNKVYDLTINSNNRFELH